MRDLYTGEWMKGDALKKGADFAEIAAKYDQKDYIKVKGGMKIAVQDLFDSKGIPIKF